MHVTLINAPWIFPGKLEFVSQNLGLAYLAGAVREAGHEVEIVDALALGLDRCERVHLPHQTVNRWGLPYDEILERIPIKTGLIGIGVPFTNNRVIAKELSLAIRDKFPQTTQMLGGVFPSTLPHEALFDSVDFVMRGEGEYSLPRFLNGEEPATIPGLVYRRDGTLVDNGPGETHRELDRLPKPARDLLPMDTYINHSPRGLVGRRVGTVVTSRGCPYSCGFCSIHPISGHAWRVHSAERVVDEIEELIDRYGINHIEFEDDNMTIDLPRARAIVEGILELRRRGKPITWEIPNGVRMDALGEAFIELCAASGNRRLYLPLEHGDPDILEAMDKKLRLEDVEQTVRWCRRHGVKPLVFVMVGYPGETEASFRRSWAYCRRLRSLGVERFEVFLAKPYPGTPLYRQCVENGYLTHPDAENIVMHMDYAGIQTPDFTAQEALRRRRIMKADLNPWILRWKEILRRLLPASIYNRLRRFREASLAA